MNALTILMHFQSYFQTINLIIDFEGTYMPAPDNTKF